MSDANSARMMLRTGTAALHAELDALLAQVDFNDRASYAKFLLRQASPLFAIERAIDESALHDAIPDWSQRRRSGALRQDLSSLGVTGPEVSAMSDAIVAPVGLIGALYVLEGSRLGAKYLVRQARASNDPIIRAATAYLGHGEAMSFWATFLKWLAECEDGGLERDALVDGARGAFAMFLHEARRSDASLQVAAAV